VDLGKTHLDARRDEPDFREVCKQKIKEIDIAAPGQTSQITINTVKEVKKL
jgi:hypothetical protein